MTYFLFHRGVGQRMRKRFEYEVFHDEVMREVEKWGDILHTMFKSTVSTWRQKPVFEKLVTLDDNGIDIIVTTHDNIYRFLNDGTSLRWAIMSEDWVSKTAPGQIFPGQGKGRVKARGIRGVAAYQKSVLGSAFVGAEPMPGIEARDWTGTIYRKFNREIRRDIRNAIKRGLRRM